MRKTFKSIGKQRRVALLSSALLLCSTCMIGQNVSIKGKVLDISGEPLLGVNVLVKGTTNGTITDLDGNFVLEADAKSTLVISYIGYVPQEVKPSATMTVTLKEDTQNLSEIVVTGYSTQQKKDITGSVAVVDTKELLQDLLRLNSCKVKQPVYISVSLVLLVLQQWFVSVVSIP